MLKLAFNSVQTNKQIGHGSAHLPRYTVILSRLNTIQKAYQLQIFYAKKCNLMLISSTNLTWHEGYIAESRE